MLKTITTFAALATLAATTLAPAHAFITMNGGGENGLSLNGGGSNGASPNGLSQQGTELNGGGINAGWTNGLSPQGTELNGGGDNGAADGSSMLTIQAIELPPETR